MRQHLIRDIGPGAVAAGTGAGAMLFDRPFLTSWFRYLDLPVIGKVPAGSVVRYDRRTLRVSGYGSVVFGIGGAVERGDTRAAHHDQEEQVGRVAKQQESDEHAGEAALEHGVDACGEEHAHDDDEHERDRHDALTPGMPWAPCTASGA